MRHIKMKGHLKFLKRQVQQKQEIGKDIYGTYFNYKS